jgi:hypothetical protein
MRRAALVHLWTVGGRRLKVPVRVADADRTGLRTDAGSSTESAHMLLSILHTAITLASTVGHTIGTLGAKW